MISKKIRVLLVKIFFKGRAALEVKCILIAEVECQLAEPHNYSFHSCAKLDTGAVEDRVKDGNTNNEIKGILQRSPADLQIL